MNEKAKFIAKLVTEKISGRQDLDLVWVQWLANNKKKPKRYKKKNPPQFGLGKKITKKKRILAFFFARPTVKKLKRKKIIFKQYNTPFLHLIFFYRK